MEHQRLAPNDAARELQAAGIEIVREHVGGGPEIRCRCPDHPDEGDGHLYVSAETGAAFCHKCKRRTHLRALCGRPARPPSREEALRQEILAATASYYHAQLMKAPASSEAVQALRYLGKERALPEEIIERFQVGWAGGGLRKHLVEELQFAEGACLHAGVLRRSEKGVRDFLYQRIIFPNVVGRRVVHLSGRSVNGGTPKWLHLPGEIAYPYNADALGKPDCLWVEGILDVLSAEAWGHPAAAGLGTHFKGTWLAHAPDGNRILVCLDGDAAGNEAAPSVAAALGNRARIVTLPQGKDLNDLLREGRREELEGCLGQAHDLITLEINRIPADVPKSELPHLLDDVLARIASSDPASCDAYLDLIKERFALTREGLAAYRKIVNIKRSAQPSGTETSTPEKRDVVRKAVFEGLVDLVEQAGAPAFLTVPEGLIQVATRLATEGETLVPPDLDNIPWVLPRAEGVRRANVEDKDGRLYDNLVAYFKSVSDLPDERYHDLQAAWTMHTWLLESSQYSPIICLYAVPERGKTRTGKAMIYVAYRGIHVESLRDPYIVRFAANFEGTILFDVMNLWRKAEKAGSEDILLGRFERGFTVPRVVYPERGPHQDTVYYKVFGPTVIATNEPVHHILDTRAVTITMPQARRAFETDVTPEAARPLRERLVAFRARHLGEALPELDKPASGRLGDILKPIVQVVRLVRPERERVLRDLVADLQRDRLGEKADTLESEILRTLDSLRDQVSDSILAVKAVTEVLNEDRPEKAKMTPQRVGRRLRSLGFRKGPRASGGSTIEWDEDKLQRAMEAYGLTETTHSAQTADSGPF